LVNAEAVTGGQLAQPISHLHARARAR
jgi:hypothetical protein